MESITDLPSSGLFTVIFWGLNLGFCLATQGHSETFPDHTLALSWLYVSGHCHAERLLFYFIFFLPLYEVVCTLEQGLICI